MPVLANLCPFTPGIPAEGKTWLDSRATAAHRLTGITFLPFLDAIAINHLEMKTSLVHY